MNAHSNLLFIDDRFAELGRETAFVYRRGYRTLRWTYADVARTAHQFARELESRGIVKGDRILLWGDNSAEWVTAFFGCALRGIIVVPMDRTASPDFARRVAQQTSAKLSICSRELLNLLPSPVIALEDLAELVGKKDASPCSSPPINSTDPLEIVFTSGTTAEPKGVVLSHGNVLSNLAPLQQEIAKYRRYERIVHPLRFLNLLPLSHVFGQFLALFIPQSLGATVIFHDSLNPAEVMRTIRDERVSLLVAVPRMMESLRQKLERDLEARGRLEHFRQRFDSADCAHFLRRWWTFRDIHREFGWKFWAFLSGGAALPEDTEQFWSRVAFAVIQGYGLTETTSLISVNHPFKVGRGSIGKVLPGREVKLDPQTGEILVRGGGVASGYWSSEDPQSPAGDGWLHTGDLGSLDADGNLYFKGRKKNVIVTDAGMNIYPEDLEVALRRQPAVRDCVVIALPAEGNAEPCAVLLLRDSKDPDSESLAASAVRDANQQLADFQQIRRWLIWPEQDFPRTSAQKPRIAAITEYAQAHFASTGEHIASPAGTVAEMIERITHRRVGALNADARLESDLNLSSIDRVELMSALEDRLQTDLDETAMSQARTVGEIETLLRNATPTAAESARAYHYPRWAQRWPHTWLRPLIYYALTWPPYTMLMAKPRIVGRDNLRSLRGPALIVSNHVTYIDIGFILAALPHHMRTHLATAMQGERLNAMRRGRSGVTGDHREPNILMRAIYKLSYALTVALFNVFPLPQLSGVRQGFDFAGHAADRGYSILVFPEGRRTDTGELQRFQNGIGLLANKLNLPVIPMRIDGLWQAAQRGRHFVPPNRITVRIGAPVHYPPNAVPETIARDLEKRIRAM